MRCIVFAVTDTASRDEPRSAHKPIRIEASATGSTPAPSTPRIRSPTKPKAAPAPPPNTSNGAGSDSSESDLDDVASQLTVSTPKSKPPPRTPGKAARPTSGGKRLTKAALARAEQQRRRAYAAALFAELNAGVFGGALPAGTELVWNKRLLTTAGRAHWRR